MSKGKVMRYEEAVKREDAMEWLLKTYHSFPDDIPRGMLRDVSQSQYKDWRWVRCPDGEIIFANCIEPGITREEFDARKEMVI